MNNKQPRYLHYRKKLLEALAVATVTACASPTLSAQTPAPTPVPAADETKKEADDTLVLQPFQVVEEKDSGYAATSSLAGSRLKTDLRDIASAISVVTPEFMQDTASTDLQHILVYQTNAEASGIGGNYYGGNADDGNYRTRMLVNPLSGTRVRGLDTPDLMREFFATNIPMDAYNTSRVDVQRGSNSILFGLGSPAGIINTGLKDPGMRKLAFEGQFRVGSYGSTREVLDIDVPLLSKQLGIRVVGLNANEKYRQKFTFNHDKRVYAALSWRPVLAEHIYTQFDVKAESGTIGANRPVAVTAADFISNWFGPLKHYLTYNPLTNNGNPQDPTGASHPELSHYFAGAPARDWWNDSPATIFQSPNSSVIGNGSMDAYRQRDGVPWGGLSGVTNVNYDEGGTGSWNKDTAAYYAGNSTITSIINNYQAATGKTFNGFGGSLWPTQMILSGPLAFIDRTMQGPNKREWNNFDSVNLQLTQTYFAGRLGYKLEYDKQNYRSGYANAIATDRVTVDVNATLRDGSANPDVGRPMILGPSSGQMNSEKREASRGTGFYKFNVADFAGRKSLLATILGEQTFTGVLSKQRYANFSRSFNLYAWDALSYGKQYEDSQNYKAWWGNHYIGSSLMNVANFGDIPASAIQGITADQTPALSSNTLLWDNGTQSWHKATVTLDSWQGDLSKLYTGASQGFDDTKSKSFVWQGKFVNNAIQPLFGWRSDDYTRMDKTTNLVRDPDFGNVLPFDPRWDYSNGKKVIAKEQRRSWGLVVHAQELLDLVHYKLPQGINVSFNYSDSNSFRPSDVGTDIYGRSLAAPSGTTRDKGFLIEYDNKLSLRVTWYKTLQKGTGMTDPSGMIYWAKAGVARTMNALAQEAWGPTARTRDQTTPEFLVNKWFFGDSYDKTIANQPLPANWRDNITALVAQPLRIRHAAVAGDPSYVAQGTINPDTGSPFLSPFLNDEEMAYRQAWFAARTNAEWFRPLDPTWVAAEQFAKITGDDWRIWGEGPPSGEKLTNDLASKGVEFELTANPTKNWRLTLNVAKNEAVRSNILPDWAAFIAQNKSLWFDGYNDTPVSQLNYWTINGFADIRHWTGDIGYSGAADTFGGRMMQNVYSGYQNAISTSGQAVNELRKWRMNVVSNYTFTNGWAKNINVGGAIRWQDKAAIGYFPKYNSEAAIWVTDVTNPIFAPSETNYDMWIGYERRLNKNLTWSVQLNVRDLFAKSTLIPITANPDGTVAQARIPSETTWYLTNTLKF